MGKESEFLSSVNIRSYKSNKTYTMYVYNCLLLLTENYRSKSFAVVIGKSFVKTCSRWSLRQVVAY